MCATERKVCFVLQQVSKGTHMDYVYEMARSLREGAKLPVTLLIEKGGGEVQLSWIIGQRFRFAPLRVIENFILMLMLRMRGHTTFYIHYSFLSLITAGIVTRVCGGTVYYWNAGMPWLYKRGRFEEWYQKLAYRFVDRLVTGARALAKGYADYYGIPIEKISVIPNWIDLSLVSESASVRDRVRSELDIPADAKVLLFVHKLVSRKGAHLLPDIFRRVEVPGTYLVVAGDGPLREEIEHQCTTDGTIEAIRLLGQVDRDRVTELMQAADVFVMPSEEEGSPHALIEAMAYELPFVAFDVGGVRETAPSASGGFLYAYPDVTGLAHGIRTLLLDSSEYKNQQAIEREWVARFDKGVILEGFIDLLLPSER